MRKSIGLIAAVVFMIATVAALSYSSIRSNAAWRAFGSTATDAQIDVNELTKTAHDLPIQNYDAF
jgi:hypothetical protein